MKADPLAWLCSFCLSRSPWKRQKGPQCGTNCVAKNLEAFGRGSRYLHVKQKNTIAKAMGSRLRWWLEGVRGGGERKKGRWGMVAHTWNPSILGGHGRRIRLGQEFRINPGNIMRPHLYKK